MKYAVLIYGAPEQFEGIDEVDRSAVFEEYLALIEEPGVQDAVRLRPVESAVTVRVRDGQVLTTDGPFPEMKEFFAGFYLLEADSADEAITFAARVPAARMGGAIEVRPLATA